MMDELIETCRKLREMSVEDIRRAEDGEVTFPSEEAKRAWINQHQEVVAEMDRNIAQYGAGDA